MAREAFVPFLVTMMLVTGVCNTILNKYQDMQCVRNCDSPNPSDRKSFEQPVIQTAQMFVGELGCFLVVFISFLYNRFVAPRISAAPLFAGGYCRVRNGNSHIPEYRDVEAEDEENEEYGNGDGEQADDRLIGTEYHSSHSPNIKPLDGGRRKLDGWRILMLAAPACCDILGTTMMNAGLLFVAASIYQMTRGALVLFVGLFSVLFLRRKLYIYQWSALVIVVVGVAIVGLSGALFGHDQAHDLDDATNADIIFQSAADLHAAARTPEAVRVIVGVLLIAAAQIFTATQFVLEEWILEHYAMDPLVVVGWEGFFGLSVTVLGMVILYLTIGVTDAGRYGYFDMKEGWRQVTHNRAVAVSSLLIMVSIGGFNFFGLSVTRTVSATSRSTIDTSRTLFIWLVSLGLGWETFKWLQVVGFALLVYGTFLFNDIIHPPLKACLPSRTDITHEELLPEEPIEHI